VNAADVAHRPLPEPAWGSLISIYFVLIGVPSGLTLVSWWLRGKGYPSAPAVERYCNWMALAGLLVASGILLVDLGRPFRFISCSQSQT
jgi:formate-dependent nitrite reductase membrane component NrfD